MVNSRSNSPVTKILLIDDEVPIRRFIRASLDSTKFELLEAGDGADGIQQVALHSPKLVLLDLGLPDMDGVEVVQSLREWTQVPILVISARGREKDKVAVLDAGADDYLTKPFGIQELMARIRVALRHSLQIENIAEDPILNTYNIKIDLASRQVTRDGLEVHLTPIEFRIVASLAKNAGRVVTHKQLLLEAWGPGFDHDSHYLRVYMGQIRTKLEVDPAQPRIFTTDPGIGYRLRIEE